MTKIQFILALSNALSAYPAADVEERIRFYCEMIEDRIEDGLSEEEAVGEVGSVEEIAAQIAGDLTPEPSPAVPEKKRISPWTVTLLILGAPVWSSLLVAAFAVVLSVYVSLWAVAVSLWAVFGSLAACGTAGVLSGGGLAVAGFGASGLAVAGGGLVCAGLSIFLFFGCRGVSEGLVRLTRLAVRRVSAALRKKEGKA